MNNIHYIKKQKKLLVVITWEHFFFLARVTEFINVRLDPSNSRNHWPLKMKWSLLESEVLCFFRESICRQSSKSALEFQHKI